MFNTVAGSAVCEDDKNPICADFQGAVTVREFSNEDFYSIGGYVAINPTQEHIVVAFKGSTSFVDVISDLTKNLVPATDLFPGCKHCSLHHGFKNAFSTVKDAVEYTVKSELRKPEQKAWRVVVTGHSLGGAVATIAAAYLRARGIACDLYAYGSPRVGTEEFAHLVTNDNNFSARITNGNDVVTALPWFSVFQPGYYAHIFPEYWYKDGQLATSRGYETAVTKCSSKEECAGPTCGRADIFNAFAAQLTCSSSDHFKYIDNAVRLCRSVLQIGN
ncbi:lipase precursor [Cordyceps javanica]|uniref:Lipase n=1 Tax=Cordyceps javanica TaxID=43265 RepID=A0A545V9L2_9HYPO|nr:lipase precursor [Cordyceps javanica]TQW09628.1 lipase precursor [Cordyceps javanica]